jgi:hypothetical protein
VNEDLQLFDSIIAALTASMRSATQASSSELLSIDDIGKPGFLVFRPDQPLAVAAEREDEAAGYERPFGWLDHGPPDFGEFREPKPFPLCRFKQGKKKTGRNVILISFFTPDYYYMLSVLVCSLKRVHPAKEIAIAIAPEYIVESEGGMAPGIAMLRAIAKDLKLTVLLYPKLEYPHKNPRYSRNWSRLRYWQMDEWFDSIVSLDADMAVRKSIAEVFDFPFAFASSATFQDNRDFGVWGYSNMGFFFLRPCRHIFAQMRSLADANTMLQFRRYYAEQDFLNWYFKLDRALLPFRYNFLDVLMDQLDPALWQDEVSVFHFVVRKMNSPADYPDLGGPEIQRCRDQPLRPPL